MNVPELLQRHHGLLRHRRLAMDELGYEDIAAHAAIVEQLEFVRDLSEAYLEELRAESRLPRGHLRAALHKGLAAVEADDVGALAEALLAAAEIIEGRSQ